MTTLQVVLALAALTLGPVLVWCRRDNVFAYMGAGTFVAVYLVPLAPTLAASRFDHAVLALYGDVLLVGAVAFLAGLALGAQVGARSPNRVPLTFARAMGERVVDLVSSRARWIGLGGAGALVLAFAVMGYVPLFAADRTSAKFGVGAYRAAFERGALFYRFGLAAASAALPVVLAVWYRRRRWPDLALAAVLVVALVVSLSRDSAFSGPFLFALAVAIERRWRPWVIATLAAGALSVGTLVSLAFVSPGDGSPQAVADRVADSSPDIRDHIGFLKGFEARGEPTYGRTLLAGLSLGPSEWDPSTYALSTLTGFRDLRDFAAGGLRLPAPVWGYASFGWAGVAMFSAVSGLFAGWGLVKLRRLLTPALAAPGAALAIVVAATFYNGTFRVLSEFYFLASSAVVDLAVALALGVSATVVLARRPGTGGRASPGRVAAVGPARAGGGGL
ncbi:MAG: hypothetical protein AB1673_16925 [Actinomycetota bacterium]